MTNNKLREDLQRFSETAFHGSAERISVSEQIFNMPNQQDQEICLAIFEERKYKRIYDLMLDAMAMLEKYRDDPTAAATWKNYVDSQANHLRTLRK